MIIETLLNPSQSEFLIEINKNITFFGIHNRGKTCYISVSIQFILRNEYIFKLLISISAVKDSLLSNIQNFVNYQRKYSNSSSDSCELLINSIQYHICSVYFTKSNSQNDVAEFITFLLEHIASEMNNSQKNEFSNLYFGSEIICTTCEEGHEKYENSTFIFLNLMLSIDYTEEFINEMISEHERNVFTECLCVYILNSEEFKKNVYLISYSMKKNA